MSKTILVADDSKTIRHVVNLTFYATGFRVVAAATAKEAVERMREEPPDLLLADVGMPGTDGYQLCEQIKGDARFARIPVLLMAGAFEPFDERRAHAARADGHIKKPFDTQALLDQVKRLTGDRPDGPAPLSFAESLAARAAVAQPNGGGAVREAPRGPQGRPDVDDLMSPKQSSPFAAPRAEAPRMDPPRPEPARVDPPRIAPVALARAPEPEPEAFDVDEDIDESTAMAGGGFGGPSLEPPAPPSPADEARRRAVDMWALSDENNAPEPHHSEPVDEVVIEDMPEEARRPAPAVVHVAEQLADRAAAPVAHAAAAAAPGLSHDELVRLAKDAIEKIAWEVVPELAETIIREELRRLLR
jgi:CheY-like chemotaxis protein